MKRLLPLLLALALLAGCSRFQPQPPKDTVHFQGEDIELDDAMDRNPLTSEDFTPEEDGSLSFQGEHLAGIDVSAHQGEIDWQQVADSGVQFAILRIGYRGYSAGSVNEDKQFRANLEGAEAAGLKLGVYFFSQAITPEEAAEEARFVLDTLDGHPLALPIAYDWEYVESAEARTNEMQQEGITQCALAFCQTIRDAGLPTAVYFNSEQGYFNYDLPQLKDNELWYAEYSDSPSFAYAVSCWQYSSEGSVPGIKGNVDLDFWFLPQSEETEEGADPQQTTQEDTSNS